VGIDTRTETETAPERGALEKPDANEALELGFVVLHCPEAPGYVGAWLAAGQVGDDRLLGRGPARPTDRFPRLTAVYQRPGANQALGPLPGAKISRVQLEVAAKNDGLLVRNVGAASLLLNGVEKKEEAHVAKGDIVEIGSSLMLLCAERPRSIASIGPGGLHDFGGPDPWGIVGESPAAWDLRRQIRQSARLPGHILVRGPTGAGKELVVRAICALVCPTGPVVERSAATLPESLLDAELFGNPKNFPNAGMPERAGLVGEADGGVLFLDEIAELPLSAQTHLLRVLDSGQYQRIGESKSRNASLRLVGATNRALTALREDVLARFTLRLEVPALAARAEDIPLVLRHLTAAALVDDAELCARYLDASGTPRYSRELLRRLVLSPPAANARELLHVVLRSVMESKGNQLDPVDADTVAAHGSDDAVASEPSDPSRYQRALDANNGSIEKTWRALGLPNRYALQRAIKRHRLVVRRKAE
jgi:two-component system, NtrC family, response regulator HydG